MGPTCGPKALHHGCMVILLWMPFLNAAHNMLGLKFSKRQSTDLQVQFDLLSWRLFSQLFQGDYMTSIFSAIMQLHVYWSMLTVEVPSDLGVNLLTMFFRKENHITTLPT